MLQPEGLEYIVREKIARPFNYGLKSGWPVSIFGMLRPCVALSALAVVHRTNHQYWRQNCRGHDQRGKMVSMQLVRCPRPGIGAARAQTFSFEKPRVCTISLLA